jgi:hypothetical protein
MIKHSVIWKLKDSANGKTKKGITLKIRWIKINLKYL